MASSPKQSTPAEQAQGANSQSAWASMFNTVAGNADREDIYGTTQSRVSGYVPYTDPMTGVTTQIPRFTQRTTLSPGEQQVYQGGLQGRQQFVNLANKQLGNVSRMLDKPLTQADLPAWQRYGEGPKLQEADPAYRQQMVDSIMQSHQRNVAPQRDAEAAKYAAQGMMPGSAMDYTRTQGYGDIDAEAGRGAFQAGGQEARAEAEGINKVRQAGWNNANLRVDQGNAQRQAQWDMNVGERTNIINELMSLFGAGQHVDPQRPDFTGGQVNPFDYAGAMQKEDERKMAAHSAKLQGITSILGAFNPLSMFG